MHIESAKDKVERAFEIVHALVAAPLFCSHTLERVKSEARAKFARLEAVLEHRTGVSFVLVSEILSHSLLCFGCSVWRVDAVCCSSVLQQCVAAVCCSSVLQCVKHCFAWGAI